MINQYSGRDHSDFTRRLAYHRQFRSKKRRPIKIVEAEQTDFLRARNAKFLNCCERSQSHQVVCGENRCRTLRPRQQLHGMKMAALHIIVSGVNHRPVPSDASAAQRPRETFQPVYRRARGSLTGNDSNPCVA